MRTYTITSTEYGHCVSGLELGQIQDWLNANTTADRKIFKTWSGDDLFGAWHHVAMTDKEYEITLEE